MRRRAGALRHHADPRATARPASSPTRAWIAAAHGDQRTARSDRRDLADVAAATTLQSEHPDTALVLAKPATTARWLRAC